MLTRKAAALAIAAATILFTLPAAQANEIERASHTVGAIERDLGAVHRHAGQLHDQMSRAMVALQWHARMEQERGAQMDGAHCARPANPDHWNYCAALYRDLQEHVRLRHHWAMVVETSRAGHLAAVRHIDELNRAGQAWKTRLAALQGQRTVVAWNQ